LTATNSTATELAMTEHAGAPIGLARLEVQPNLAAAEPAWRALEHHHALTTPYQRYDFLSAWQRHVGTDEGVKPFVVTGYDSEDNPLFLWPLGQRRRGPLGIAQFLGGSHANYNFGIWRRDVAEAITADDLRYILSRLAAGRNGADLLVLLNQPESWDGIRNPFALLPHQESVNDCSRLTLSGSGDEVLTTHLSTAMRGRLRTKERKLQKLADYRYFRAETPEETKRLLDVFFPLKAKHFAAQGLADVFAEPGVRDFFYDAACGHPKREAPLIEIHALEGGGEVLAIFAAITDGERLSLMFNTYTLSANAKHSPGLILLTHVVGNCADRGLKTFDLGVGEAGYKTFFCGKRCDLYRQASDQARPQTDGNGAGDAQALQGDRADTLELICLKLSRRKFLTF